MNLLLLLALAPPLSCLAFLSLLALLGVMYGLKSDTSSFFDVQLPKRRPAHDRFVQKIALTAVVDQADNSNLEATSCGQLSHAKK